MKPKTMILMGLAITCGLGASYMTSQLLAQREPAAEVEKVEILVARRNLSVGDQIKKPEDMFEKKAVTLDLEPKEAIKDFDVLKNKIMKQHLRAGDHVTLNELYGDGDALPIPEGYQAVGLRVNLEGSASGFATLPHSRVNILHTVRKPDDSKSYCAVLLQDVLVLAADLKFDRDGSIAAPASVVTFALTSKDILKINLANQMGTLSLALRKPNDRKITEETRMTGDEIYGKKKEEPKVELPPPPPVKQAPAPVVVEEPKGPIGTQHDLLIIQGPNQQRTTYFTTPDGRTVEQDPQSPGAPPVRRQPAAGAKKGSPEDL